MPVADRLKQPLDRLCREFDWTQLECPIFIEAITDLFGLFRAQ